MKFSIRSSLLVVTIVAIALGWWLDHVRLQNANARLNAENTELLGRVTPSSGFAYPSGLATKTYYLHSSPEDRKELLFLLDNSLTLGKDSNQPLMTKETPSETR